MWWVVKGYRGWAIVALRFFEIFLSGIFGNHSSQDAGSQNGSEFGGLVSLVFAVTFVILRSLCLAGASLVIWCTPKVFREAEFLFLLQKQFC